MANKEIRSPRQNVTPDVADEGDRLSSKLVNGSRSFAVDIEIEAVIDITVAGASVLNRGSLWAAIEEIGIDENGRDRHLYDGRLLRFVSEMHAPSPLSAVRLATAAIQTVTLREAATIWFGHPLSAQPHELTFREADPRQSLEVFVKRRSSPENAIVSGGTKTLGPITVRVVQRHDPRSRTKPIFIPSFRQIVQSVDSANSQLETFVRSSHFLRAIVVQQEDVDGEQSGIINSLALRGDFRDLIGAQNHQWAQLVRAQETEFGGLVASNLAYLGLNFQRSGRLSNVVNPADDVNLRFEFDVQPVGASSKIRIGLFELERVPGLTVPKVPFPV